MTTIHIDNDIHHKLDIVATKNKQSIRDLVTDICRNYLATLPREAYT